MATYHVNNKPYWYDDRQTSITPLYTHLDETIFEGLGTLPGVYSVPNSDNYYWGVDRIDDLNNANYKPNSTYAYSSIFTTGAYEGAIAGNALLENIDYNKIYYSTYNIWQAEPTIPRHNIHFCLMSVKLATNPTAKRNYYLELHMCENSVGSVDGHAYSDCSININIRVEDYEVNTNSLVYVWGGSGFRLYDDTYAYKWNIIPTFGTWYNGDTENPSVVYYLGFWKKFYSTTLENLPLQSGADITNNGHTFKEVTPTVPNIDQALYTTWESTAYAKLNPNNVINYEDIIEEMGPYGPESDPEGYPEDQPSGHGDDSSDTIDIPDDPLIGITNVGFVNVYKTGVNSLQNMGVELFPDLQYTNPTPISGSADVISSIENGFNAMITALANVPSIISQQVAATLINYIIDCHVIPVTPSGGTSENIKVGYKTLTATGDRLNKDYETFDCGTIKLGEYYGSFADFMTSAKLFLPFVGFVPARPEWFYADTLGVKYKFNVIDGSFQAYVTSTGKYVNNKGADGTVIAQYSGNACVHLPITGVTYASMVSGLVGAGAGAITAAGSGNIAGVASSVVNAAGATGDIPQSNAYSSSAAFLSIRRPFLLIERPVTNYSPSFRKERGLPSNITRKLSTLSGFAQLNNIHLDSVNATDAEKKELETLFNSGVIF